ncbi:MAG TPA: hypothetical protein VGH80_01900 [Xanthomonadaceae bacterium]|jgi:hypothetical protein
MKLRVVRIAALAALAVALGACRQPVDPEHVAAKINQGVPKPYVDGLVIQHAHVDGKRLVVDIRIPFATVAKLDPKKLPFMRTQEQGDLNIAACKDDDLHELMKKSYEVSRRFLDKDGKLVFEIVAMKAPNCKLFGGSTP